MVKTVFSIIKIVFAVLSRPSVSSAIIAFCVLLLFSLTHHNLSLQKDIEFVDDTSEISLQDKKIFLEPTENPHPDIIVPEQTLEKEKTTPTWLEYRIRRGDTMDKILHTIKADETMRQFLLTKKLKSYRRLRVGQVIYFNLDDNGYLEALLYKTTPEYYLTAGKDENNQPWAKEEEPVIKEKRFKKSGRIDSSLFLAAEKAGMHDAAIDKLIVALESQIDFYRHVRKGDFFRVIYNAWYDEYDSFVKMGDIDIFEYTSHLRAEKPNLIQGIHHPEGGYFSPKGEPLLRAFLPAPLKYRRVSSRFTHRRFHPVLKRWRAHRGVDYAARTGTPVFVTADGVITKVRTERGYGRVIFVKHYNIYTTVYAHLSKFAKGMKPGKHIKQGEVIGYVGQSGLATGPHLHYEFRVKGVHKDPLSVELPRQLPPLKKKALVAFQAHANPLIEELKNMSSQ